MGYISGVDVLDQNSSSTFFRDNQFTFVTPLDLFRYSTASTAAGTNVIDWTAGNVPKYFSLTGGSTNIAGFSTGSVHGDGQQASHWKDNLGLGIMDPTAAPGELLSISSNDTRAFDVIGYNRKLVSASTPEPSSLVMFGAGGLILSGYGLRRRKRVGK